jgi:hypothetical protein
VVGNNFFTGATVYLNSISRATQFVSSTQLTASILASDVTGPAGQVAITVENPPPSAGISSVSSLVLQNPAPMISSVTPSSVLAGNPTYVTLTGSGFVNGATAQIGNQSFRGNALSPTNLQVEIDAPVGINTLTVTNPAPTVGTSNGVSVTGTAAGSGLSLTVVSVDPSGNTVASDDYGGAVNSTGRYYSFGGLFLLLRDTCLGAPTNCAPSTVQYAPPASTVNGVSADGRYITSNEPVTDSTLALLVDVCTGAPAGCVPSTTLIPTNQTKYGSRTFMTPNARYMSYSAAGYPFPGGPAYIFDMCVGAAPGCTITQIPVATQTYDVFGPILSDDGRYAPYTSLAPQILLHDSCLGAPPGCSPSDSAISTANCWTPSISGNAQYVAYTCADGLKLQATCLNASPSCNPAPIQIDSSPATNQPPYGELPPIISASGRYVAYRPAAATINGQTLASAMVFVFDSCIGAGSGCTQQSVPVCLNSSGAVANSDCVPTGMTADGQYVVFQSSATNLGQAFSQNVSYVVKNPLF